MNNNKLSIVTTLYCSESHIKEFYERIVNSAEKLFCDIEIIMVNDGSPDNSLEVARELCEKDQRLTLINLSKNFGHHKAMFTGLKYATGDYIFLIDSDLEEAPELLSKFMAKLEDSNSDVIYGVQQNRKGNLFERISGAIFYWIFNKFADINLPKNVLTIRLMRKKYLHALLQHTEYEPMFHCLALFTGYKQEAITVKKESCSETTYSFKKKCVLALNSITSFSNKPLYFIFYTGTMVSGGSILYILYLIAKYFIMGVPIVGWTSLMASVWFIGGVMIFFLGLSSIYISKIFVEVKNRPFTIVKEIINYKEMQE